ncbi:NAD(P)/FAD-dependent oxidoreductase [Magnetovibrio blakemorei]|uniref:N-acyl-L-homoserine lactone synthetase n=1 Tax=Magnetovibrio blakemorei TaxID=28181 RepID=A0A1E5Q8Q5_9PROT|nr:FAD-dependent oxidoreductase [Magnetovibrio blakemorei]OEJ67766.1 N-acyl-L-homoserine lactone synthetase [Magnetovibrio blakemorei]
MTADQTHADTLIIGSGMAGYTLARELRTLDPETRITVLSADDGAVYSKPMISNAFKQGKTPDTLVQKSAEQMAAELNIEVRPFNRVHTIDRVAKAVSVEGAEGQGLITYTHLVLAVGANPRPYTVDGSDEVALPAVNSLADYGRWRANLKDGARVLIVGAGLIGVEFANDLAVAGYSVTLVDPAPKPLSRLLPDELGQVMQDALTDQGITFYMGRTIARVAQGSHGNTATLDDGTSIAFDTALTAIGLVANTQLAQSAGLEVGRGIRVDALLRTSDPNVFALGDCAETDAGVLPFILPLMGAARALAKTLMGTPTPLSLPALAVTVKTPALPTVVCPPSPGVEGRWVLEGQGQNRRAVFIGQAGEQLGFALTGSETKARQSLSREMPDLLAA